MGFLIKKLASSASPSHLALELLEAFWAKQPRAVRVFTPALEVLWDNTEDRPTHYPLFKDETGRVVDIPPAGPLRNAWPVTRTLAERESRQRQYLVKSDPPGRDLCFRMRTWLLEKEPFGPLIIEEIERIDQGFCHDERLKDLDAQLAELMHHVAEFMVSQSETSALHLRLANPNLQPCHEIKQCKRKACPGFKNEHNLRCWELPNTFCPEEIPTKNLLDKIKHCEQCNVYLMACPDPLTRVGENFNRLLSLLQLKYLEALEANRHMQQAEKMAAIGELTTGIAHEIKNPLSIIMSRLDCLNLEFDSLSRTELAEDLEVLKEHAARMKHFLDDLLTLSRPAPMRRQRIQLNNIIHETLPLVRKTLEKMNISLKTRLTANLPELMIDPVHIQQVLLNLILNARDAMPEGGQILITTEPRGGDPAWVKVSFKDTGRGIEQDQLNHIFSPFYSLKAESGGTGLGLAVCSRIMHQHGGRISVASRPGKGAKFNLFFRGDGSSA